MLQECLPPTNKYQKWCGLEGQVLNHLEPLPGEFAMGSSNGQYSAALWPRTCEQNGTVAGAWTQPTSGPQTRAAARPAAPPGNPNDPWNKGANILNFS